MKKIIFNIEIKASAENVWKALWEDKLYRDWTKVFSEGSHAITDWQQGSKVLFLDGTGNGMYSTIKVCKPYEQMSIEHIGHVKDGKELPLEGVALKWTGALEEYFLTSLETGTALKVHLDSDEEFENYFQNTFPKALEILKANAEKL